MGAIDLTQCPRRLKGAWEPLGPSGPLSLQIFPINLTVTSSPLLLRLHSNLLPSTLSRPPRYHVNIYAPEVPPTKRRDIALKAQVTARTEVGNMRQRLAELFPKDVEDSDEEDEEQGKPRSVDGRVGGRCS